MNMDQDKFMAFMTNFKATIEQSVKNIGEDINNKLDAKLNKIDKGMDELREQVKDLDAKHDKGTDELKEQVKALDDKNDKQNKDMEARIARLEAK